MAQYIAHRGATSLYLENTLPAFVAAIERGYDGIELDLWTTNDNHLVIYHDEVIRRNVNNEDSNSDLLCDEHGDFHHCIPFRCVVGPSEHLNIIGRRINELSLDDIQKIKLIDEYGRTYNIPTLYQLLDLLNDNGNKRLLLNLELKDDKSSEHLIRFLHKIYSNSDKYGNLIDNVEIVVTSFLPNAIIETKRWINIFETFTSFYFGIDSPIIKRLEKIEIGQLLDPSSLGVNPLRFWRIYQKSCLCIVALRTKISKLIRNFSKEGEIIVLEDELLYMLDSLNLLGNLVERNQVWVYSTKYDPQLEALLLWKYEQYDIKCYICNHR